MNRETQTREFLDRLEASGCTQATEADFPELRVVERELVALLWRTRRPFSLREQAGVLVLVLPEPHQRPFPSRRYIHT